MPVGTDRPDRLDGDHRAAAAVFAERAREQLGSVVSVHLFGSVAAGHQRPSSDVDLLVVVADDADYDAVDDRLLGISYDVRLEYGVPVEVHSLREADFAARRERGDPFVRTVLEEGERV